jgi:peptidoglycan/LPS O-acetylase OafA/YrhL
LRGVAALLIVFHHSFIWPMLFAKGITNSRSFHAAYGREFLPTALWYGYSGVDLFFLLSGFCLLYPVFSRPDVPYSVRRYAVHRLRRIYPPYFASLLAAICLAAVGASKINAHLHAATEPVHLRNVITAVTLTESHFCAPFWSLVVEAQWYFIVPILAILWKRSRWAMHGGMALIIALLTLMTQVFPQCHLGLIAMYLPMFWIGIVFAEIGTCSARARLLLERGGWLVLMLIGIFAICLYVPGPSMWRLTRAQGYPFAVLYSGLLAAAIFTPFGKRLFSSRWMVKAGSFSYSLYLIHALVIYAAIVLLDHYKISGNRELLICFTVLPALCIGVGYLFYLAVEKRVQRPSTLPRKRQAESEAASTVFTAVTA